MHFRDEFLIGSPATQPVQSAGNWYVWASYYGIAEVFLSSFLDLVDSLAHKTFFLQ